MSIVLLRSVFLAVGNELMTGFGQGIAGVVDFWQHTLLKFLPCPSCSNKGMQPDRPFVTPFEAVVQKVQNELGQKLRQSAFYLSRLLRRVNGWFQIELSQKPRQIASLTASG